MKKTKKMAKGGDVLGTLSPAYGIATGRGLFGKLGEMGLSPAGMLADASRDKKKKKGEEARAPLGAKGMRRGGKVRGDGVCQRGKTKGRMV